MYTLIVKATFSAAHRLEAYHGKCEQLHGHNYGVEVVVEGEELNSEGMLVDFAVLKGFLREVITMLDHTCLNEISFFRERSTSSEHIARFIFDEFAVRLPTAGARTKEVRVWESDNSCAMYGK